MGKVRRCLRMKKVFVEPQMSKIELNLNENIAESGSDYKGLHFNAYYEVCTIQTTTYTIKDNAYIYELLACMSDGYFNSGGGTTISVENYRMYTGR